MQPQDAGGALVAITEDVSPTEAQTNRGAIQIMGPLGASSAQRVRTCSEPGHSSAGGGGQGSAGQALDGQGRVSGSGSVRVSVSGVLVAMRPQGSLGLRSNAVLPMPAGPAGMALGGPCDNLHQDRVSTSGTPVRPRTAASSNASWMGSGCTGFSAVADSPTRSL